MADVTETSSPDLVAALIARDDIAVVILTVVDGGQRRPAITPSASASVTRRRAVTYLEQAAGQIEAKGSSLVYPS